MNGDLESSIAAARRGDPQAFARVLRRYSGLLRHVIGQGVDPGVVEDLVQETCLAAWHERGKLREGAAFKGWLVKLATYRVQKWQRRQQVERSALSKLARPAIAADRASAGWSEAVLQALAALTPETRSMVLLRFRDGMNAHEIADALGMEHDAVRRRLSRALRTLRQQLQHEDR